MKKFKTLVAAGLMCIASLTSCGETKMEVKDGENVNTVLVKPSENYAKVLKGNHKGCHGTLESSDKYDYEAICLLHGEHYAIWKDSNEVWYMEVIGKVF